MRVAAFPFAQNLYGDAVVRAEMSERFAEEPRALVSYREVWQFGPLPFYVNMAVMQAWGDRDAAPRAVSLVAGTATVAPLYRLAAAVAGPVAAGWAGLAFAVYGMHVQASTTAASEALFLLLLLWAIERFFAGRLAASCLLLNLAEAVRYDGWLYAPLIALLVLRRHGLRKAAAFAAGASVFPALWMLSNAAFARDALLPMRHVAAEHGRMAAAAAAEWGEGPYRAAALVYWPAALLLTLTPVVAALAFRGAWRMRRTAWELLLLAWVPALLFTVRGALLLSFWPLARFTLACGLLMLPFLAAGSEGLPQLSKRLLTWSAVALALALPAAEMAISWNRTGPLAAAARRISPVTRLSPALAGAADWLRENAEEGDVLYVDRAANYDDIPVVYHAGLPEERVIRRRWPDFPARIARTPPTVLATHDMGELLRDGATQGYARAAAYPPFTFWRRLERK